LSRDIFGLFYIEKQGLAMRLGKGGGSVAALLRNQFAFGRATLQKKAFFSTILADISYAPLFDNAL
jgi:hypothetical protein